MAMTKKDFVAMAEAVADTRQTAENSWKRGSASYVAAMAALDITSERLADACARQYAGGYGFDRQRFLTACGM